MEMPYRIAAINDTLQAGKITQAINMTDRLKSEAITMGDSTLWSEAMVQQGVNAYYQGNPSLVLASSDSALSWIERQKPTPARARFHR